MQFSRYNIFDTNASKKQYNSNILTTTLKISQNMIKNYKIN